MKTIRRLLALTTALILATSCSSGSPDDDRGATSAGDTISPKTVAGAESTPPSVAAASHWTATPFGIGPVRVGMSVAEVDAVAEGGVKKPAELQECDYIAPRGGPAGLPHRHANSSR